MVTKRLWVLGLGSALMVAAYAAVKQHSPAIVAYVVEQTLVQKSPVGMDKDRIRRRFHDFVNDFPDGSARLEKLLTLSQTLEKTQKLNELELDQLLRK